MSYFSIILPSAVNTALSILEQNGYEANIVGGCLRNMILGIEPKDFDIATNALPEKIADCFSRFSLITIGMKHGTVAVIIDGMQIEITTYRIDGKYSDQRHPDSVSFTTCLKDDLSRRDFTVNSLAWNKKDGLIDYFGGVNAIKRKEICCVGNPSLRFEEDALRIMRAVRFTSQLGFLIEKNTEQEIHSQKESLKKIAVERLHSELDKLLAGKNVFSVLTEYSDVIAVFIPEVIPCVGFNQHSRYHKYTVWEHIAKAVESSAPSAVLKISALLHDIEKPSCFSMDSKGNGHFFNHAQKSAETADKILHRLRYDNKTIDTAKILIANHSFSDMSERPVKRLLAKLGEENFFLLLGLHRADNSAKMDFCKERLSDIDRAENYARELIAKEECFSLKKLSVNGNDIMNLGISGRNIGIVLNELLNSVVEGKIPNEKERLLKAADDFKEKLLIAEND